MPDHERDLWIADWHRQMNECARCGNPVDECSDPMTKWYPYRSVCYATMARHAADNTYDDLHKSRPYHDGRFEHWSDTRSSSFPFHARDGVAIGVSTEDRNPDDYFLGKPTEINAEALQGLTQ